MKKLFNKICLLPVVLPFCAMAQTPPGTDILIGHLGMEKGKLSVTKVANITDREGYDNQPFFLPDGQHLFYTSAITDDTGKSQTDSIMYNLSTGERVNLTESAESEYSPTLMPDKKHFSVIHVTSEGKQKFWGYSVKEKKRWELLADVEPVGYQAWVNDSEVVLFILGEPHTLQLANVKSAETRILDANIGSSLYQFPGKQTMTYTRGDDPSGKQNTAWSLMEIDTATSNSTVLTTLPGDAYYFAWTPDGKALAANGSKLLQWDSQNDAVDDGWHVFGDMTEHCKGGISRLAVNDSQTRIAMVCTRSEG